MAAEGTEAHRPSQAPSRECRCQNTVTPAWGLHAGPSAPSWILGLFGSHCACLGSTG